MKLHIFFVKGKCFVSKFRIFVVKRVLLGFGDGFARALEDFERILIFYIGTPALSRSAPRSVTICESPLVGD